MERTRKAFAATVARTAALGVLFVLGVRGSASAQLGHVVKAQKISDTSGGFSAQLDEQDQFGRSIVNLGDLDGDGVTDLLVGAHTDDDGGLDKGSVYVLFLHANGFVKAWQKISDLSGNFPGQLDKSDQFGRAAASLGDLDGDGVVDVAVGANYDDDGGANQGAVYVLFLNPDGTVKAFQKISETAGGLPVALNLHDEFGRSICAPGDLDGDGVTEIVVGTPEDDEGGTNTGALHVLFLNPNGTVKAYRRISKFSAGLALKPGDWFGFCSTSLGDFDGDGVTDLAVGAVLDDDGGVNQGSVWILLLNPDGSVKRASEIDELEGNFGAPLDDIDQFGTSVANIGDLDGDGVTDIVVGAVKDDDGGNPGNPDADVGAAYVLFLQPDATVKSWLKISDTSGDLPYSLDQYDWFGSAVCRLGGSPGDGLFNVAIGCRNDDDGSPNRGAIFLTQLNDGTVPAAGFTASRTLGVAPLTVSFTDTSSGEVTAWLWDFSDGPQSSLQHPTKTFSTPGTFDVRLTVRGPAGTDVALEIGYVTVSAGPLAAFDAAPRSGPCPLTVAFSDLSEGTVTGWLWDFGDGTTSSEPLPVHTYADCGSYTVTLTVTGPSGTGARTEADFVVAALEPPGAAFSAAPTSGPAPLDVQFTDTTGGQVTAWLWDFGDGTGSTAQHPLHTYTAAGSYTIALTASGPGGSDVVTQVDLVVATVPPPAAFFEATPTIGPEPLMVAFTDVTTGVVSAWAWDFGDGATSSEADPVHVYAGAGVYTVALTASGPGGSDTRVLADLITVEAAPPGAALGASPTRGPAPLAVQFTDLSTLSVTSWQWDFGDGSTSAEQHPSHVYAAPGLHTVALAVAGPGGSDSITLVDLITVDPPLTMAEFDADVTSGPAPLSVAFRDASSVNVTAWAWDFGDGSTSVEQHPGHVYAFPGLYGVTLTVVSPTGTDSLARMDYVRVLEPAPLADFRALQPLGVAPLTVQFEDLSQGLVTAWAWDFGDGSASREPEPAHIYSQPGNYAVTLAVSGPGGSDTFTCVDCVVVTHPAPVAAFVATPTVGTAPLSVQFDDASANAVTSWSWDFGDGTTSSESGLAHVYEAPGTYTVTLAVTGPGGADTETKPRLITVQEGAVGAGFTAAPTSGVAPLAVQFADASSGTVTSWAWDFGDGSGSSLQSPAHEYASAGTYTVALTATGPSGTDVETQAGLIAVQESPPVAAFAAAPTGGVAPLVVQFADASSGAVTSWAWDFGDGSGSSLQSPSHEYVSGGNYTVALTVSGPAGTDGETKLDLVRVQDPAPVADFLATPTSGVAPLTVQFTDASSSVVTSWAWDFGDGTGSTGPGPAHVYATPGTYTVALVVFGPGGTDGVTRADLITVQHPPPVADFAASPREGYAPLQVAFTDLSTGEVSAWRWTFGDGSTSTLESPAHLFPLAGSYPVTLDVTGPGGTSSRRRTIVVREAPVFGDGSFEAQVPGREPGLPWSVYNGNSVLVRPTLVAQDNGFPFAGANWCDIGADGTAGASPPSNPRGPGTAATGAAGIQQDFLFPVATPQLFFEAAFLLDGSQDSSSRNDFMSVDVTDGTTTWNLLFADSFADFPLVSGHHGLPMTAPESVHVDLRALYPAAGETTVLSLRVSVGNGGNGNAPSRGYVDAFRFEPSATAAFRNGQGLNPAFYVSTPAVVGGSWTVEIDASAHPLAGLAFVSGRRTAIGGIPMLGGEVLVGGPPVFSLSFSVSGGREQRTYPVPADPSLVGYFAATQGVLLGGGVLLGNAYDLRLGY